MTEVRPGQAWRNDAGDRFVVVGRLTDGTGWAVSRGKLKIERVRESFTRRFAERARTRTVGRVALFALLFSGASCGKEEQGVMKIESVSPDGRTLTVMVGSCNGNPRVTAEESASEVVLSARGSDTDDGCADVAMVTLDDPLGERVVLDRLSGQPVLNPFSRRPLELRGTSPDGLKLTLAAKTCDSDPVVAVTEDDDRVVVDVPSASFDSECRAILHVMLSEPLGEREIVDPKGRTLIANRLL